MPCRGVHSTYVSTIYYVS